MKWISTTDLDGKMLFIRTEDIAAFRHQEASVEAGNCFPPKKNPARAEFYLRSGQSFCFETNLTAGELLDAIRGEGDKEAT